MATQGTAKSAQTPRTLRVVLYPFIPGFSAFKDEVVRRFQAQHPEIQLQVIDLTNNYYGAFSDDYYIGCTNADVYELDSVFLQDFVINKKIQPLPADLVIPENELLTNAVAGATVNNKRYGVPHWACSNFLFFKSSDKALLNAKTLDQLVSTIGPSHAVNSGLMVDLKGKSTLGEFYLNADFDRYQHWTDVEYHVNVFDSALEDDLRALMTLCDAGFCRNDSYHGTGLYGEEFARRHARALVGYSELLNSVLTQSKSCVPADNCLIDSDIDAMALPLDSNGAYVMSWVDSFVIDSKCKEQCLKDASDFLKLINSDDLTLWELLPAGAAPAYLLPAKVSLYGNPQLLKQAHLYPTLRGIIEKSAVPSSPVLNDKLRATGRKLDSELGSH